jgi:hypothetical protein
MVLPSLVLADGRKLYLAFNISVLDDWYAFQELWTYQTSIYQMDVLLDTE